MVAYIRSDLDFILAQIKIAEAHAAGQPLYGEGGLIPAYNISWGLRTVDGSYNHLLPGQEKWGASDTPFKELLNPTFRTIMVDPDGAGPSPAMPMQYRPGIDNDGPTTTLPNGTVIGNRAGPGDVIDPSVRVISNLLVDQTLSNPAAILTALQNAGIDDPGMVITGQIAALYIPLKPLFKELEEAARDEASAAAAAAASPGNQALQDAAAAAKVALEDAKAAIDVAGGPAPAGNGLFGLLATNGIALDGINIHIPNSAPDEGLSAPFNSWFTLFGQFFDHGLDLVNKGGSGTVMIPLSPDDPLYVPGSSTNFMVLTRATVGAGPDGQLGTSDDVRPVNTTTAYVDQNQTYTSHPSHQVFLRQYAETANGPVATGNLIEGANGGMATWGEVKAQARNLLGIQLTDQDVGSVPLLRTDPYGNFIPGSNGFPLIVVGIGPDGIPNTPDDLVVEGNPAANGGLGVSLANAVRTNHAFLADIAHNAVPNGIADGDITIGLENPGNQPGVYDNELLDAHFVAGDGRANENIGLTAVHHVFHAEHNRLAEHTKVTVLETRDLAFINEWLAVDITQTQLNALPTTLPTDAAALKTLLDSFTWDGERLFQAAKFGTEMQYQHLVFEEFARKVQPNINVFLVPDGFDTMMDPTIFAEFAHVVYRFGHSMLTESIDQFDPNFNPNHISLIQGFLNPTAFTSPNGVDDGIAAGAIIRGMTRQVGNEIDEFVTSALRNNLLGLPLDLATINLARGRDVGMPSLNEARAQFYAATNQDALLKPYESWTDFAGHLKHEASIINFIAAYGTHQTITAKNTAAEKRDAAMELVLGVDMNGDGVVPSEQDRFDFLNATGAYAGGSLGGLNNVDFWIGGLAEEIMPFGGMLGSTFNFVFEAQMELLQSGDRFYYLQRLDGLHLFGEMENNSFAAMMMRNTDATHLPSDVFSTPGLILEVDQTKQFNDLDGDGDLETGDPTGGGLLTQVVIRNNPATSGTDTNYLRYNGDEHVVMGGTNQADTIIASDGDDTLYGDGGNDRLEGDFGNDIINGGDGDDIIVDSGGDDNIKAGKGNDVVHAGPGLDLVMGNDGQDFIFLGTDMGSEVFAGTGNDFIYGNRNAERILGNEGNDWIETGTFDGAPGDNFDEVFAHDGIDGHDVFLGDGGFDEFIGEGGDDIMVGSTGRGKMAGMSGFDWATYKNNTFGVNADLSIPIVFDESPTLPQNAALDEYASMEGLSGTKFNDTLAGSDAVAADRLPASQGGTEGYAGSALDAAGIALINGLQAVLGSGVTSFSAGDIILGGDGSDVIRGNGGDDIIDGDKWLDVQIGVFAPGDVNHTGTPIALHNSMTTLAASMFSGAINPGQLAIVRTIRTDATAGDVDVAAFSGVRADYDIVVNANGTVSVLHARGTQADGTDTLRNIERLRFSDMEIAVATPPTDIQWNSVVPGNGFPGVGDLANGLPAAGAVIANLATTDDDTTSGFVYALAAGSSPGFAVSPAGVVTRTGSAMASNTTYTLNISSTDTTGGVRTETFTIRTGTNSIAFVSNGSNNLIAGPSDTVLYGSGGNDTLAGSTGNDNLFGQSGDDFLNGGGGNDIMAGGSGDDTYVVDVAGDTVTENNNEGTDTVQTSLASYTLGGNVENLTFTGSGNFSGTGNTLSNDITGGAGNDSLNGDAGNDELIGNAGDDTLNGGSGNDVLNGGNGADSMTGAAGNDTYVVDNAGDTVVENANEGTDTVQTSFTSFSLGANLENLTYVGSAAFSGTGNESGNVITGDNGTDTLLGMGGNDALNGDSGNDSLDGGVGDDTLDGGAGDDMIIGGTGNDTINLGGGGNDIIAYTTPSFGADIINSFDATGGTATTQDRIDLSGFGITAANFANRVFESTIGGFGNTLLTIRANGPASAVIGTIRVNGVSNANMDTSDFILAQALQANLTVSSAIIAEGAANRTVGTLAVPEAAGITFALEGPSANMFEVVGNQLMVRRGVTLDYETASKHEVTVVAVDASGMSRADEIVIQVKDVSHFVKNGSTRSESLMGTNEVDTIKARGGHDIVRSGDGHDRVYGEGGHDKLYGGSGNDKLHGGSGNDRVDGGSGSNRLTGGSGDDVFVFNKKHGIDTVTDFRTDHDRIDVSGLAGVNSMADLTLTNTAHGVAIGHAAAVLVLNGVKESDLDSSDFIF
jgi:Ca2+-binding RTX toxin-like protein